MKKTLKVVFKNYTPHQTLLLPPSLEELLEENHPVRTVNSVIEKINLEPLLKQYKGGGTSSYHPKMLLKVLVYAYLNNIYSSRKIEAGCKENIHLMWLSAMSRPDHNTINRFRSERLKNVLKEIFAQVVLLLVESGHLSLKEVYVDGTKIEANANRYTFVWGNAIKTSKERIKKQLEELWRYTQSIAADELQDETPAFFEEIDTGKVKQTIEKIDQALKGKPVSKKIKQKINYARKNWPENLKKYAAQEKLLGKRGSYSKTDKDATFMRMKEDHMKNGQLKPAYNLQLSTYDQFILQYTLHQTTNDTNTLKEHLAEFEKHLHQLPNELTADAGYGSEQNYALLEEKDIEAFVKDPSFDREQKGKRKNEFHPSQLYYNKEKDCYYCPMGQEMKNIGKGKRKTANGYQQTYMYYQAQRCYGCPLRGVCHKAKGNRIIEVNHRLNHLKEKARQRLLSEKGIKHRKKRPADVEPVFANIKHNKNFKRFMLRGKLKVEIETGLIALAHNLRKMAA